MSAKLIPVTGIDLLGEVRVLLFCSIGPVSAILSSGLAMLMDEYQLVIC